MARDNIYIGARYVPIFDGEYSNSKAYEPLTIVQYLGNSYTSKTYVPIGVTPTNETYWVLTGNFNAQISQLQETVDGFNARISEAEDLAENASEKVENIAYKQYRITGDGGRRVYVSVNGSDVTGDGTSSKPWRSINKAFFECENRENDVRIYLRGAGAYDWSGISVISSMAIHIEPEPATFTGNINDYLVNIYRNQTIYDSHVNLQNISVICEEESTGCYFEGGSVYIVNVNWLKDIADSKLVLYGTNSVLKNVTCRNILAQRCNLQLLGDYIKFTNPLVNNRPLYCTACTVYVECAIQHTGLDGDGSGNNGYIVVLGGSVSFNTGAKKITLDGEYKFSYGIYNAGGIIFGNPDRFTELSNCSVGGNRNPRGIFSTMGSGTILSD